MIAAGFGCRSGCAVEDLVSALTRALMESSSALGAVHTLCAPEFRRDERALTLLAETLARPLVFFSQAALENEVPYALTDSPLSRAHKGLPSVAETCALAGARMLALAHGSEDEHRVLLLGPRVIAGGVTCALAKGGRT